MPTAKNKSITLIVNDCKSETRGIKSGRHVLFIPEVLALEGRSIVFASGKGGTGKTTTVANLGVALAQFGKEVILLDADITMANLSLVLGMEDIPITLHDVLAREADLKDAIYEGPAGVKVIPGGLSLEKIKKAKPERLRELMREIGQMADFILIDAPAGLEMTSVTALLIGKELIIVTNPEISAITDSLKTKLIAEKLGTLPLGAILNRVTNEKTELTQEEIEAILEVPVLTMIPEDPEVKRASAYGVPLVIKNPTSPAAIAIKQLAAKLAGIKWQAPEPESPIKRVFKALFGGKR
jgi:septum site-determining protein MinD